MDALDWILANDKAVVGSVVIVVISLLFSPITYEKAQVSFFFKVQICMILTSLTTT